MAQRDVSEEEQIGKLFLFLGSLALGIGAGVATYRLTALGPFATAVVGPLVAISHPFVAAVAVQVCEDLHKWAFPDTYEPWSVEKRVAHGAAWPVTLCFWVVVSVFYAAINRLFS
jgi:hypothetical protein